MKIDMRTVRASPQRFADRIDAGRALAAKLTPYQRQPDAVVVALPRGGVQVGYEVAISLVLPLDILVVRKLGVPGQEELALGAIASGGITVLNEQIVQAIGITAEAIERVRASETNELRRRERLYRGNRPPLRVARRTLLLVDDGLATGATMRAAVKALRQSDPARIVVAAPVASVEACAEFSVLADECVCVATPEPFYGVGGWYESFAQTSDGQVRELLDRADEQFRTDGAAKDSTP